MRQAGSIGGGTTEMARNVISERVLGMPRERTLDRDVPFRDVPRSRPDRRVACGRRNVRAQTRGGPDMAIAKVNGLSLAYETIGEGRPGPSHPAAASPRRRPGCASSPSRWPTRATGC